MAPCRILGMHYLSFSNLPNAQNNSVNYTCTSFDSFPYAKQCKGESARSSGGFTWLSIDKKASVLVKLKLGAESDQQITRVSEKRGLGVGVGVGGFFCNNYFPFFLFNS